MSLFSSKSEAENILGMGEHMEAVSKLQRQLQPENKSYYYSREVSCYKTEVVSSQILHMYKTAHIKHSITSVNLYMLPLIHTKGEVDQTSSMRSLLSIPDYHFSCPCWLGTELVL